MPQKTGETPRLTEKLCASCGNMKPAFKFKRKLTIAQTRARGGIGNRRMEVISKNCTECRAAKTKRINTKTPKQLQNLHADGVISAVELRARTQAYKERGKLNMVQGVSKSWDNRFVLAWGFYITACEAELKRSQAALRHLKRDEKRGMGKPELLDFYTAYVHALRIAKLSMQSSARKRIPPIKGEKVNPSAYEITRTHEPLAHNYPRYIPDPVRRVLYARWDAVPPEYRSSGRRVEPEAVFWREPEPSGETSRLTKHNQEGEQ